jgi:hypothetical protein
MSKKSKRNISRRNRLAALRAEVAMLLEGQLKPHHMQYNARKTEQLIREFKQFGGVPAWATSPSQWWPPQWWAHNGDAVHNNHNDAMADVIVYGQGIYKMDKPLA